MRNMYKCPEIVYIHSLVSSQTPTVRVKEDSAVANLPQAFSARRSLTLPLIGFKKTNFWPLTASDNSICVPRCLLTMLNNQLYYNAFSF